MFIKCDNFVFLMDTNIIIDKNKIEPKECEKIIKLYDKKDCTFEKEYLERFRLFRESEIDLKKIMPTSCGINLTNECSLRCNYCSYASGEHPICKIDDRQLKTFLNYMIENIYIKRQLNIENKLNTFYFAGGGEPTHDWRLLQEAVNYIEQKCFNLGIFVKLGITTNLMVNQEKLEWVCKHFSDILVSYDGIKQLQDRNRPTVIGTRSSDVVENNLMILNQKQFPFSVRTTIWPYDYHYLYEIADHIFSTYENIETWAVEPVLDFGRAKNSDVFNDEKKLISYDFQKTISEIDAYVQNKYGRSVYSSITRKTLCKFNCGAAFGYFPWLNCDGNVYTCLDAIEIETPIAFADENAMRFNKYKDSLSIMHLKYMQDNCKNCIALPFCGGGCPIIHNGKDNVRSINSNWHCDQRRKFWLRALTMLSNNGRFFDINAEIIQEGVYQIKWKNQDRYI